MLTKLTLRNFKQFDIAEIELGGTVVLIGPNNSGKTTALQAIALWEFGLKRWQQERAGKTAPTKRPGVTINRRDLIALPVPDAHLLWRDLHVREVRRQNGRQETQNVRIDIVLEGVSDDVPWACGLEFDYANQESFYCRPLRGEGGSETERMTVPEAAYQVRVAFLQPMSGLAANETRLDPGAINVRLGEGRTAEVLRNLCYRLASDIDRPDRWRTVQAKVTELFGVELGQPEYIAARGEIAMDFTARSGAQLDLSASGRGMQQTLLLLAHIALNPGSVLLLDEPDAHLEILRQRQIYNVLTEAAREHSCQLVIASHSEVILNEAGDRDVVVAFVGRPHRIDDRSGRSEAVKALREIGFDQYYQAEIKGWVLYVEGTTDVAILRAFAATLDHPVRPLLDDVFVHTVGNDLHKARRHFHGLREAKPDLVGYLLCDQVPHPLRPTENLCEYQWQRREIENYLCQPETLLAFSAASARPESEGPLFAGPESERRRAMMDAVVRDRVPPGALRDPADSYWHTVKASDELLDVVFRNYAQRVGLPEGLLRKTDYHQLARFVPRALVDPEVVAVLDGIYAVSQRAKPVG